MYAFLVNHMMPRESFLFAGKVLLGSFLLAAAAQVQIPFWPVPMTLQMSAILLLGFSCNPSVALGSVLLYIFEGAVGLPVFSGFSSGLGVLLGTRGGYFVGFALSAYLISILKDKTQGLGQRYLLALLGEAATLLCGMVYLSTFLGVRAAFMGGVFPFLLKGVVNAGFVVWGLRLFKR